MRAVNNEGRPGPWSATLRVPVGASFAKQAKAWLARFGRTVAGQVVDAVGTRLETGAAAPGHLTLAGERIWRSGTGKAALGEDGDRLSGGEPGRVAMPMVTGRELLSSSSFHLPLRAAGDGTGLSATEPFWTLWGSGAFTRFDGREGDLTLDGRVTSAMGGVDWSRQALTLGLMLSHGTGEVEWRGGSAGEVASTLTGIYPYGRYQASERLSFWGVAGGATLGQLTLTPEGKQPATTTDMDLTLGAVGVRGLALRAPEEGGLELVVNADAMAVRITSEERPNLEGAVAQASRLRLGLEGMWRHDGPLTPTLDLALHHEGGDGATTGLGLELGGTLRYAPPSSALSASLSGRTLVVHADEHYREWGISGALVLETGADRRGLSFSLNPSWGADASGLERLVSSDAGGLSQLVANHNPPARGRLDVQLGYGLPALGGDFTATPSIGVALSEAAQELRLGWRLEPAEGASTGLQLDLEATRRQTVATGENAEHGVGIRLQTNW